MELPSVTGSRHFQKYSATLSSAPSSMPSEARYMYSTVCGSLAAAATKKGRCSARAFEMPSWFCVPSTIATVTRKPQGMARRKRTCQRCETTSAVIWSTTPERHGSADSAPVRWVKTYEEKSAPARLPSQETQRPRTYAAGRPRRLSAVMVSHMG